MPKYKVWVTYICNVPIILEADNEEEAAELAFEGEGEYDPKEIVLDDATMTQDVYLIHPDGREEKVIGDDDWEVADE